METVTIYTDGACKGNPGPGGYAAILTCGDSERIIRGNAVQTTNNRMELTAVIEAISVLKQPCHVTIVTDSTYVMISKEKWMRWKHKPDLPNRDLWERLIKVGNAGHHHLTFQHVMGHTGDVMNERCDRIAKEQATKASYQLLETVQSPMLKYARMLEARK